MQWYISGVLSESSNTSTSDIGQSTDDQTEKADIESKAEGDDKTTPDSEKQSADGQGESKGEKRKAEEEDLKLVTVLYYLYTRLLSDKT